MSNLAGPRISIRPYAHADAAATLLVFQEAITVTASADYTPEQTAAWGARRRGATQLSADVSITARPFFESSGFQVDREQHPVANGVVMTNFHMTKALDPLR